MQRRQELESKRDKARRRLEEAKETREGSAAQEGWFKCRLEGKRQEKQARQVIEDTAEKLERLPSERALKKQVGKDIQSLGGEERQQLGKALSPAQRELASRAVGAARKAAEKAMSREHERDRGMGMGM